MSEEEIYDAITEEVSRYKSLGYDAAHDDRRSLFEWGNFMGTLLPAGGKTLEANEQHAIRLAAMCVALVESIQRRKVMSTQ